MKKIRYGIYSLLVLCVGFFGYMLYGYMAYEAKQNEIREFKKLAFEGYSYVNAKEYDKAYESYKKAIAIHDEDSSSLADMAMIYRHKGELKKAKEYYQKAYEANKDKYNNLYNVALLEYMNKEYQKSIDNLMRLIHIDRDDSKYYRLLSANYYGMGEKQKAFGYYRVVDNRKAYKNDELTQHIYQEYQNLEQKPESLEVVYAYQKTEDIQKLEELIDRYIQEGFDIKALRTAQKVLMMQEDNDKANKTVAKLYYTHNALSEVYAYISKVVNHDTESLEILGGVYQNKGEYKKALEVYERSYAKKAKKDILRAMVVCAWKSKNENDTLNYLERLKQIDPKLATQLVYAMGVQSGVENNFFDKIAYLTKLEFFDFYCKFKGCDDA